MSFTCPECIEHCKCCCSGCASYFQEGEHWLLHWDKGETLVCSNCGYSGSEWEWTDAEMEFEWEWREEAILWIPLDLMKKAQVGYNTTTKESRLTNPDGQGER